MHQKAVEKSRRRQKNSWGITGSAKSRAVCLRQWGMMLLCVLFFSVAIAAADTPPANDADKWKLVEGQVKNLEASYKNAVTDLKSRFDVQKGHMKNLEESYKKALDDLNKKFELQKKEADLRIQQIENDYHQKYWLLKIILGIGFAGLIAFLFRFYKRLFKNMDENTSHLFDMAEKKTHELFEKLLQEEKDRLFQVIRLMQDEIKIKKEYSLLVLSAPDDDEEFLKNFFNKMGFHNVQYKTFEPNFRYGGEDLILFNDENGNLNIKSINNFVDEGTNKAFYFYFGKGHVDFSPLKSHSFANARGQLYGNLMNALLQHDLFK